MQAVCFDLWGTLIDEKSNSPFHKALARTLGVAQEDFTREFKALGPPSMIGEVPSLSVRVYLASRAFKCMLSSEEIDKIVQELIPLHLRNAYVYPDVIPTLTKLRSHGLKLGMISNASSWTESVLDELSLRPYFEVIVLSYQYGEVKPMPGLYEQALRDLNVQSKACFYVGDGGDHEMEGAKQVGFTTVLVDRYVRGVNADFTVSNLTQALAVIESNL